MNRDLSRNVRRCVGVSLAGMFFIWFASLEARAQPGLSRAEDEVLAKRVGRIDQDKLLKGNYPLREVVEVGRHLFSTPYTKKEGYGEGGRPSGSGSFDRGPREQAFLDNLEDFRVQTKSGLTTDELREFLNFPVPTINPSSNKIVYPYMRLNGLDSQSCFECHNSIGSQQIADTRSSALTRKQSTVGGPAGFASNAFINEKLPNPMFMFVRNPPHVFGIGYVQELAEEMTFELLGLRTTFLEEASSKPGVQISHPLKAKTTEYGKFTVTYTGDPANKPDLKQVIHALNDKPGVDPPGFKIVWADIQGVSEDLVVRPFQWKGIASNERNFVRDALQFHFGMQAREKNTDYGQSSEDHDSDKDGISDELSEGDVSALTIYTMSVRPPIEVRPLKRSEQQAVARGRSIFEGTAKFEKEGRFEGSDKFSKDVSCAKCHTPSLQTDDSIAFVRDPREEVKKHGPEELVGNITGLSARVRSSAQLPVVRQFMDVDPVDKVRGRNAAQAKQVLAGARSALQSSTERKAGYAFDLTTLQPANPDSASNQERSDPLSETQPRLPASGTHIDVPLFSDLRRHKMGELLRERKGFRQSTDVQGVVVAEDEFLTRPLWGVGDTGPWLHDGRAQSLEEAILLHASKDSEANDVIAVFQKLSKQDKEAVIAFLLSLRLPVDPRYGFDDYR